MNLALEDLELALRVAKTSLLHHLAHGRALYGAPSDFGVSGALLRPAQTVFCSLSTVAGVNRGCRAAKATPRQGGTLFDSIRLSAAHSAFDDDRFSPCTAWLLDRLNFQLFALESEPLATITSNNSHTLAQFSKTHAAHSIALLDGPGGKQLSIFLPGVAAAERGTDKFVHKLSEKAGVKHQPSITQATLVAIRTQSSRKAPIIETLPLPFAAGTLQ